jgi:hypothetical protein
MLEVIIANKGEEFFRVIVNNQLPKITKRSRWELHFGTLVERAKAALFKRRLIKFFPFVRIRQ